MLNGDADRQFYANKSGVKVKSVSDGVDAKTYTVTVKKASAESFDFVLDLSQKAYGAARSANRAALHFSGEMTVGSFVYNGALPSEVVELKRADISSEMSMDISFDDNISKLLDKITEVTIELPSYMDFVVKESSAKYTKVDNRIVLTDLSTSGRQSVVVSIKSLDFGKAADTTGSLTVRNGKVDMLGNVTMGIMINEEVNLASGVDPTKCKVACGISFMNDILLTTVTGRFSPTITLDDLGHTSITGLPDFLSEDGVKVDIENPQIVMNLTSDIAVAGVLAGVINYKRDGANGSVKINENINVKPAAEGGVSTTRVCICRKKSMVQNPDEFDQIIEQDNLKEILYPTVATDISFNATAWADDSKTSKFELGRVYTIQPEYEFMAPLAFGEDANIVYTDNLDGWNGDIDDFDLKEGGYVELTANVENRVPVYLNVDAVPVGVNGEDLSGEVSVEVIGEVAASTDGLEATVSPVKVKLTPKKGALKKLDGLKLIVSGSAKSTSGGATVTGIPLNAKTHTLVAKDINVKVVGTIVADLN